MPISVLTTEDFKPGGLDKAKRIFEAKTVLTSEKFDELSRAQRAIAFRVWQVNEAKLIQAARAKIRRVLDGKMTFRELRNDLAKLLDLKDFSPGTLQRIRILYQQNALQAYSLARRAVMEEPQVAEAFPFWRYMTVGDGTPGKFGVRKSHADQHGKVYKYDDPIWQTVYPPWGWGCRCFVIPMTAAMVKRLGLKVESSTGLLGVEPERSIRSPSVIMDRDELDVSRLDPDLRAGLERLQRELKAP